MGTGKMTTLLAFSLVTLVLLCSAPAVSAQAPQSSLPTPSIPLAGTADLQRNLNALWACMAAFLVFFMQAGFAMVETGFTRAKNAVNVLMKNLMDFCLGSIVFFIAGFGVMFGANETGWFGTTDFLLNGILRGDTPEAQSSFTFLISQTVYAATAATIVSGAMAERTRFVGYLVYSVAITALIYPLSGSWVWNSHYSAGTSGWLEGMGYLDFAGSSVVHSLGGWVALAGAIVVGPRIGKYSIDGKARAIPGHNMALGALGIFILWFGWFGFNAGSASAESGSLGYIVVTTNLAGAAGALGAMGMAWVLLKKPEGSMSLNGVLAGLVSVTASCNAVSPMGAIMIGLLGGALVVLSILFIDKILRVDDPVGAISVHGVCGGWGAISCGLFNLDQGLFYGGGWHQLRVQVIGATSIFVWALASGMVLFLALKHTVGLRVSAEEEIAGLDVSEHGMEAYAGFQIFNNQ